MKRLSEKEALARLAKKHPAPAWAFFSQVRNATGFSRRARTADAIAMSVWPSRGLELHGFEIKSYRNDWLRELANPHKAEEIARFCHRWWVVAGADDVVDASEVPPAWGLLVPHTRGLKTVIQAPKNEALAPTYSFLASLLRNASESMVPRESIEDEMQSHFARGKEAGSWDAKRIREDYASLKARVAEFEKASGVKLPPYGEWAEIGRSVAAVREAGPDKIADRMRAFKNQLKLLLRKIEEVEEECSISA